MKRIIGLPRPSPREDGRLSRYRAAGACGGTGDGVSINTQWEEGGTSYLDPIWLWLFHFMLLVLLLLFLPLSGCEVVEYMLDYFLAMP